MNKVRLQFMNDTFDIKGIWYLPWQDMEKDGVEGILRYSPQRIRLELIGTLEEGEDEILFTLEQTSSKQVIYGFSNYGEWFTLFDCITAEANMSAPGFETISYTVNRFYAGSRIIKDENDEIIDYMTFSLSYLNAWMDIGITEKRKYKDKSNIEWSIDLDKAEPQRKSIKIHSENISIDEDIGYNIEPPKDYFSNETTKIIIYRFYRLSSLDKSCFSYSSYINNLQKIRRLLTLLVGSPLYFLYIDINLSAIKEAADDDEPKDKENKCRVFFTQVGEINKPQNISLKNPESVLIMRKNIVNNIETIFNNWFSQQNLLSEIVNPYISSLYLPAYQDTKFLNAVRSIETYHRFFIKGKEKSPIDTSDILQSEEQELILSFIKENISEENQSTFIKKINYEDENSLYKRLKEIFVLTPKALMHRLFGQLNARDQSKLLQAIVQTRNYFTHRDSKEKYPLAITDHLLLELYIRRLNILLQFHVLKCIGVEPDIIQKHLIEYLKNSSAFCFSQDK